MSSRLDWIVVGISGVTCGGKTTLATKLKDLLRPVYVFHQDHYFYTDDSPKHVRCDGIEHNNYDILSALDMDAMFNDIKETVAGQNKAQAFNADRTAGKLGINGKKFMIVEGFTALNYEPINNFCDLRYYLILEYGECALRRSLRLYDPPDVVGYFEQCVWLEHLRYRKMIERDVRVNILDGAHPGNFDKILCDIREKGATTISV